MAFDLTRDPQPNPTSIPAAGGKIDVAFFGRDAKKSRRLKATYTIIPASPYRFSSGSKVLAGDEAEVVADERRYPQSMTLEKVPGSGPAALVFIDIEIAILDENGAPATLGGFPVAPLLRQVTLSVTP